MAAGCRGIGHSPLFTFPAGWADALLEQMTATEPEPACVVFRSQQVSVALVARVDAGLQISGITRILIFVHKHSTVHVYNPNIKDKLFVKENMVMQTWQK